MAKNSDNHHQRIIDITLIVISFIIFTLFCFYANYPLIISLFLLFLGIHLHFIEKTNLRLFLNLGLLITLMIFITHVFLEYTTLSPFLIPVASIAMLTMLLFNDLKMAFIIAFACSLIVSLLLKSDFGVMLTFFIGSITGALAVRGARDRGQLFAGGLFVSAIHVVCLFLTYSDISILNTIDFERNYLWPFILNGLVSSCFVLITLKMFEYLFGVLTNYSLIELSDFNQPLLKRMILEAPGTYHHSLVVSNLSEAAADAIGANSLLARVGSYYHDIGKMGKPEYYTENQMIGGNKHDNIEPTMSRLVILNHVKEGIELGRKYKLNPAILDFIPQHHGTSLMYYFYQKSVEAAENGQKIDEENFRYPGPKPQIRETAITLLADSVEAATRSLDEPNPKNIEETVRKIINNKFIDGQLDECNLTLKEIDKISATFTRILSAMYHSRIKYPEKKENLT